MILNAARSQLLVVDVQQKLVPSLSAPQPLVQNIVRLLGAAAIFDLPATVSEHYRAGLGDTLTEISTAAARAPILDKIDFSCARDPAIHARIESLGRTHGRNQLILCGIEAHVCILQTALDFLADGFEVAVVADAVDSRTLQSKELGLRRLEQAGISIVTLEMAMFEWLGRAGTAEFKMMLPLIKQG